MNVPILHDYTYLGLLSEIVNSRENIREERTGVGATSLFGRQMRFNLAKGFPLLTSKKINLDTIATELFWFLKGDTNIKYLLENNVHIWTDWRYKEYLEVSKNHPTGLVKSKAEFEQQILDNTTFAERFGDIGKGYGHQWRNFGEVRNNLDQGIADPHKTRHGLIVGGFDQISWVINEIKTNPTSRRLIVSGWNPHEVANVDLPPCHTLFQFFVSNGKLSCQLYQRSADIFLGVPFNIASYALLTHMVAQVCDLEVGDFVWTGGDVHLYSNHVDQAKEQLRRVPFASPTLTLNKQHSITDYTLSDIQLNNYEHHPFIKAQVAV